MKELPPHLALTGVASVFLVSCPFSVSGPLVSFGAMVRLAFSTRGNYGERQYRSRQS